MKNQSVADPQRLKPPRLRKLSACNVLSFEHNLVSPVIDCAIIKSFIPRVRVMHLLLCGYICGPVLSVIHFATDPNGTTVIKASSWLLNLQI